MPERAEIEAVTGRRFWVQMQRTRADGPLEAMNVTEDESRADDWRKFGRVVVEVVALDRVRDARDDDEVDQTGWLTEHQRAYRQMQDRARAAEAELERLRAEAARSPQGEDHGPEPDALGGLPPSQPKEDA